MKIRNIKPNNLIKVVDFEQREDGSVSLKYLNDLGELQSAKMLVEEKVVRKNDKGEIIEKNSYRSASMKDWEAFLDMLEGSAISDGKEKDLRLQISNSLDKEMQDNAIKMQGETDMEKIQALMQKNMEIMGNKPSLIDKLFNEEADKIRIESRNRKEFFVGGIIKGKEEDVIEIPSPSKLARNFRTISLNDAIMSYTFLDEKNNELTIGEFKEIDGKNFRVKAELSPLNNDKIISQTFDVINKNVIDNLVTEDETKKNFLRGRLLNVFGKSEASLNLYKYKKDLDLLNLTQEQGEKLKELYSKVKDDIIQNGMGEYKIGVPIVFKKVEARDFLNRVVGGLENSLIQKSVGVNQAPESLKIRNVIGFHKMPTNIIDGENLADQWYGSIRTTDGQEVTNISSVKQKVGKKDVESFTSHDIYEQIIDYAMGLEKKELDVKNKEEKEIDEVSDIGGLGD